MQNRRRLRQNRLIIFGRYPVPGRVKTRLIPLLGPAGAANLQRELTEKTLKTAEALTSPAGIDVEIRFDGGSECRMRRWLGSGLILTRQGPGDLGKRMQSAFLEAFQGGCRRVVLLGTDIPEATTHLLARAFDGLTGHDLILGPSKDGGYWLIGLKGPADLFQGIKWGTERVFEQTLALAKKGGLGIYLLDELKDMDRVEDLKRWRPENAVRRPYISVIIPTLNEAGNIETAINRAIDQDAEVVVVDGGSNDDTVARAVRAGARVEMSCRGRALQQNHGASLARGSVLMFLHADTRLPSDYICHVFETLMDPQIALGAFRFKTDLNTPLMRVIELATNIRSQYLKLPYGDQGLFIRKQIFESVGGFPDLLIAEDLFLVRRLSKEGGIRIAPAAAVSSARRWQTTGALRTMIINQIILTGCYLGVSPSALAPLYGARYGTSTTSRNFYNLLKL